MRLSLRVEQWPPNAPLRILRATFDLSSSRARREGVLCLVDLQLDSIGHRASRMSVASLAPGLSPRTAFPGAFTIQPR